MNEFEKFIDLLENKNPTKYDSANSHYIHLLNDLKHLGPACIYFYEKLLSLGKKLEKTYELNNIIFQAISQCDDEVFNRHFLDVADSVEISYIRTLFLNKPNNELLKNYIESKDTPKKIDEVVSVLIDYYTKDKTDNKEIFNKELSKYKITLLKINSITNSKSRAKTNFMELLSHITRKKGLKEMYNFCKDVNINIVNLISTEKTKLNFPKSLSEEDIKTFKKIFNDYPDVPAHKILTKLCYTPSIVDGILDDKREIEEKTFILDILKEEVKEVVQKNTNFKPQNEDESENDYLVRSILNILSEEKLGNKIRIYNNYMYRNKQNKIKSLIIAMNLNKDLKEKKSIIKMKI